MEYCFLLHGTSLKALCVLRNTHRAEYCIWLLRQNCWVVQKERQKQGICISTTTDTMDITENQVKSSKPGASEQNSCALCS